jgi:hypothetical protein
MRNRALKIGVAILALASLPSCATDPVDQADDESAAGPAERLGSTSEQAGEPGAGDQASDEKRTEASSSNDSDRGSVIIDDVITPLPDCGFNYLSYYKGWSYYGFRNCSAIDTLRRQVVKAGGGTGPCIVLPPGTSLRDLVHAYIVDEQSC